MYEANKEKVKQLEISAQKLYKPIQFPALNQFPAQTFQSQNSNLSDANHQIGNSQISIKSPFLNSSKDPYIFSALIPRTQNSNLSDANHKKEKLQISNELYFFSSEITDMDILNAKIKKLKKSYQVQLNNLNSKLEKLDIKYNGLKCKYDQELIKYKKFYDKYKYAENAEPKDQSPKEILRSELIKRYLKNKCREPRGWRYTPNIYDFCKILQNICSKSYETLREVFILPTIDSLDKMYSRDEKHIRKLLKNIDSIPELINLYKQIYEITDNLDCVLSIDAASLNRPNKHSHTFVFVLYLQPLNSKFKCFPLHIYSKSSGNCDEEIINLIDKAIILLQKSGISIKAVASDGDPGYNEKARETFTKYITIFEKQGFLSAVESMMNSHEIFYISDLLHIIKLARKRIMKGPITISTSLKTKFNKQSLEEILHLGIILNDESSLRKSLTLNHLLKQKLIWTMLRFIDRN